MTALTTFAEVNHVLEAHWPTNLPRHAYTLEYMVQLMEYLGNPQDSLKVIHVAGTSGKTSTAYYAAALLKAAGKRVGLTVSPHVDQINERVQIDLVPLDEASFCRDFSIFLDLIAKLPFTPSYFELLIAFVYWEFARLQVEYAVIEVGLGGLVDGTNVVNREDKVAVITDIGFDHTHVLGKTLPEISTQKAGIIQLHNAVFCYRQSDEAMGPIRDRAAQKQADLHVLDPKADQARFAFLPLFQQRNFGLSLQAVQYALTHDGQALLADEQIEHAAHTYVPGRMEIIGVGGRQLIMDGAHNGQKMHALVKSLRQRYHGQKRAAIVSFVAGGDVRFPAALHELLPNIDYLIITSYGGGQDIRHTSVDPEAIVASCREQHFDTFEVIPDITKAARVLLKRPEPILLAVGSIYMLSHLRPVLKNISS